MWLILFKNVFFLLNGFCHCSYDPRFNSCHSLGGAVRLLDLSEQTKKNAIRPYISVPFLFSLLTPFLSFICLFPVSVWWLQTLYIKCFTGEWWRSQIIISALVKNVMLDHCAMKRLAYCQGGVTHAFIRSGLFKIRCHFGAAVGVCWILVNYLL